ncbi:hypothetical protein EVAR_14217_1 [Eumeta japonica]|uniref:Uncharacterized protein n=1 Tax=Eumeta variegata TaxID=151549 RepID=A0A4C1UEH1_EUMVA|nr:hypothetical protein EVAR_14217_1 [Eumeta japonica]
MLTLEKDAQQSAQEDSDGRPPSAAQARPSGTVISPWINGGRWCRDKTIAGSRNDLLPSESEEMRGSQPDPEPAIVLSELELISSSERELALRFPLLDAEVAGEEERLDARLDAWLSASLELRLEEGVVTATNFLTIGIWSVNLRERSLGAETISGLGVQTAGSPEYIAGTDARSITAAARHSLLGTPHTRTRAESDTTEHGSKEC